MNANNKTTSILIAKNIDLIKSELDILFNAGITIRVTIIN